MTLEELYGKIMADKGLQAEVAKATEDGSLLEWVKAQGVETTAEELAAFAEAAGNE